MQLVVEPDDPTPPYEQLRRQVVDLVDVGLLRPGDRLPPLRQLAGDLGLAVGTVARTYHELEVAGVVISRRGAGTRVAERAGPHPDVVRRERLAALADAYVERARTLGCTDDEIRAAFESRIRVDD